MALFQGTVNQIENTQYKINNIEKRDDDGKQKQYSDNDYPTVNAVTKYVADEITESKTTIEEKLNTKAQELQNNINEKADTSALNEVVGQLESQGETLNEHSGRLQTVEEKVDDINESFENIGNQIINLENNKVDNCGENVQIHKMAAKENLSGLIFKTLCSFNNLKKGKYLVFANIEYDIVITDEDIYELEMVKSGEITSVGIIAGTNGKSEPLDIGFRLIPTKSEASAPCNRLLTTYLNVKVDFQDVGIGCRLNFSGQTNVGNYIINCNDVSLLKI